MTSFSAQLFGLKLREGNKKKTVAVFQSLFKILVTCSSIFVLVSKWILLLCLKILPVTSEGASSLQHWPHRGISCSNFHIVTLIFIADEDGLRHNSSKPSCQKTPTFLVFCRRKIKKAQAVRAWFIHQLRNCCVVWESFREGSSSSERFRFSLNDGNPFLGYRPAIKAC